MTTSWKGQVRGQFLMNRIIEKAELHGFSHNLSQTDWTRPSLIFLKIEVSLSLFTITLQHPETYPIEAR